MIFDNSIGLRIGYILDFLMMLFHTEKPKQKTERS